MMGWTLMIRRRIGRCGTGDVTTMTSTLCCHDVSFDLQVTSCGDGELDDASKGVVASEGV